MVENIPCVPAALLTDYACRVYCGYAYKHVYGLYRILRFQPIKYRIAKIKAFFGQIMQAWHVPGVIPAMLNYFNFRNSSGNMRWLELYQFLQQFCMFWILRKLAKNENPLVSRGIILVFPQKSFLTPRGVSKIAAYLWAAKNLFQKSHVQTYKILTFSKKTNLYPQGVSKFAAWFFLKSKFFKNSNCTKLNTIQNGIKKERVIRSNICSDYLFDYLLIFHKENRTTCITPFLSKIKGFKGFSLLKSEQGMRESNSR